MPWRQIGTPATNVYAGQFGVFATSPVDGTLYQYIEGTSWVEAGGPGADFAVTPGCIVGLSPDKQGVYVYPPPDGKGGFLPTPTSPPYEWVKIGGPADRVFAAGIPPSTVITATAPGNGDIYSLNGNVWTHLGGPGADFGLIGGTIYGLAPARDGIYYQVLGSPEPWLKVGGPAANIYVGQAGLYATEPQTGNLWRLDPFSDPVKNPSWYQVGTPGSSFA